MNEPCFCEDQCGIGLYITARWKGAPNSVRRSAQFVLCSSTHNLIDYDLSYTVTQHDLVDLSCS